MLLMIFAGCLIAALSQNEIPINYMLPVMVGMTAFALLIGVCFSQALLPYPNHAGTASALLSFFQVTIGSVLVMVLHLFNLNAIEQIIVITSAFTPLLLFYHFSKVKVFKE